MAIRILPAQFVIVLLLVCVCEGLERGFYLYQNTHSFSSSRNVLDIVSEGVYEYKKFLEDPQHFVLIDQMSKVSRRAHIGLNL